MRFYIEEVEVLFPYDYIYPGAFATQSRANKVAVAHQAPDLILFSRAI